MKLSDANKFFLVKKRIPIVVERIKEPTVDNINRVLRERFIGRGIDSIRAKLKDRNTVMVQLSYKNARYSFTFTFVPMMDRLKQGIEAVLLSVFRY